MGYYLSYIYSLLNTKTNKAYIGQCQNLKERKRKHFEALRRGDHFNRHLQFSYNQYGEEVFTFIPLIECDEEKVDQYEDLFIKFFDTKNDKHGYNIRDGGRFHMTQGMINKMTETHRSKVENVLQIDPVTYKIVKI